MSKMFGKFFLKSNVALQTALVLIWFALVFSDIWTSILFYVALWLLKEHKKLEEVKISPR